MYRNKSHDAKKTHRVLNPRGKLRLHTMREVAEKCGVTEMTIRRWLSQGQMPAPRRLGRTWYWSEEQVNSFAKGLPAKRNCYPIVAEFAKAAGYLGTDE